MRSDTAATASRTSLQQGDRHSWRRFKDRFAASTISLGGLSVLGAILLIFFYLLYELIPLFRSASAEPVTSFALPVASAAEAPLYLGVEEQGEVAARLSRQGEVLFFSTADGRVIREVTLPIPTGERITSFALESVQSQLMAVGLSNGGVLLFKPEYITTYPDDERLITPELRFPYGEEPLSLGAGPVARLSVRDASSRMVLAGSLDGVLRGKEFAKKVHFLTGETVLEEVPLRLPVIDIEPLHLLISPSGRELYAIGRAGEYRVVNLARAELIDSGRLLESGQVNDARFLLGGVSILVAGSNGEVGQWTLVRSQGQQPRLTRIRGFEPGSRTEPVTRLAVEHRRKNFVSVDANQQLSLYNTTAERRSLQLSLGDEPVRAVAFGPRASVLVFETADGRFHNWRVDNPHPEVSWKVLWNKVWYENYPEPDYVWQSSSATSDFEPKYSLTPLAFGTLKAAFYAKLLGAPLAICGAIYTAYFMAPELRKKIKPLIELMEALPTVILGFLAGLWLAPFVEKHLPGVFAVFLLTPVAILLFAFAWNQLPVRLRKWIPDGWQPLLLVPVIVGVVALCFGLSGSVEHAFFNGDMRSWLSNDLGIDYDQRNALIVGIAMGFAVIPNIFSIAEDAIFSVPKHLSFGSLALGATPWQTLVGVVLPTASPGIFSALMIGMGRAVGETMIVLMATGNTPIMDANIFEGMRTLSANLAVEIGETEIDSTHYRVLFLAAFVLFLFTFVVNTAAEVVRQRLRKRYSVI
jgi:phosphate transport system permease protein